MERFRNEWIVARAGADAVRLFGGSCPGRVRRCREIASDGSPYADYAWSTGMHNIRIYVSYSCFYLFRCAAANEMTGAWRKN
jgi:hypothetical protein